MLTSRHEDGRAVGVPAHRYSENAREAFHQRERRYEQEAEGAEDAAANAGPFPIRAGTRALEGCAKPDVMRERADRLEIQLI